MKRDGKRHQVSKKKLFDALAMLGLTVKRQMICGGRVWELSNGETFISLNMIAAKYHIK
jgi:hypothetical protein